MNRIKCPAHPFLLGNYDLQSKIIFILQVRQKRRVSGSLFREIHKKEDEKGKGEADRERRGRLLT